MSSNPTYPKLIVFRHMAGLTRPQLGAKVGVNKDTIWKLETQQYKRGPSINLARKISKVLGVHIDLLFPEEESCSRSSA